LVGGDQTLNKIEDDGDQSGDQVCFMPVDQAQVIISILASGDPS